MTRNWMPPTRIPGEHKQDTIVMDFGGLMMWHVDKSEPDETAFQFSTYQRKSDGKTIDPKREIFRLDTYQSKKLMLWLLMGALS